MLAIIDAKAVQGTLDPFEDEVLQALLCRVKLPLTQRAGFTVIDGKMPLVKPQTQVML